VLKGIVSGEDAALAVQHGVDGIVVSNHGGHEDASAPGTIECLPEVLAGAAGKIPVLIDGGFRGGADVFKALALGATAVGIGRPHIWGLSAFGQEGVETVITLLRRELQVVMAQEPKLGDGQLPACPSSDRRMTHQLRETTSLFGDSSLRNTPAGQSSGARVKITGGRNATDRVPRRRREGGDEGISSSRRSNGDDSTLTPEMCKMRRNVLARRGFKWDIERSNKFT
jgi:FMN-dependent dehydrogenase